METKQNHLTIPIIKIPQGRLGMWILIAGELVIFGGLICMYLLNRIRYPHWGENRCA
jgi:heme/copper-type cytochrome/quinol oxidase subunit 3